MIKIKKLLLTLGVSTALYGSNISIDKFQNLHSVKSLGVKVLKVQEQGELYVVEAIVASQDRVRNITFTVTKDMKYTFYGTAFDNTKNEQIVFKKDMSKYIKASNFTYGKGKDEFLLFTDPQCPYCVKLEKLLHEQNLKDKVKIHYYLFPLSHHNDAKPMSRFVLNQSTNEKKVQALYDISVRKVDLFKGAKYDRKTLDSLDKILDKNKQFVQELGIMGTPTLLDTNGQKVDLGMFFQKYSK